MEIDLTRKKRVLIHPDLFYSEHSGAIAARKAADLLTAYGCEVGIFTHDKPIEKYNQYPYFERVPYQGFANFKPDRYKAKFLDAIIQFSPDIVFFIGSAINTPVVYINESYSNKIKTCFLLLQQDFYCTRLHAALGTSSCTRCLDGSNFNAIKYNCLEKGSNKVLYFVNYQLNQSLYFIPALKKVNFVLGSSDEQLSFYQKVGIKKENTLKIPLFFNQDKIITQNHKGERYFVIIAQIRIEKGPHLISKILNFVDPGIKVKALFYNQAEVDEFLTKYPENKIYISNGTLEILPNVTMTNGAVDVVAKSRGVINPTIWPTTTEFVLLEALGLSKPIITFGVGIHKEIIINKVNGICVNTGDFEAMGKEINNLANDDELYENISRNALKLYHQLTDDIAFQDAFDTILN